MDKRVQLLRIGFVAGFTIAAVLLSIQADMEHTGLRVLISSIAGLVGGFGLYCLSEGARLSARK